MNKFLKIGVIFIIGAFIGALISGFFIAQKPFDESNPGPGNFYVGLLVSPITWPINAVMTEAEKNNWNTDCEATGYQWTSEQAQKYQNQILILMLIYCGFLALIFKRVVKIFGGILVMSLLLMMVALAMNFHYFIAVFIASLLSQGLFFYGFKSIPEKEKIQKKHLPGIIVLVLLIAGILYPVTFSLSLSGMC